MTETVNPSPKVFDITPHDSTNFTNEIRQIYVGSTGNVTVVNQDNSTATFTAVQAGTTLGMFYVKRVNATGTTATNLVGFV